jgi:uncharacterized protein YndB with AHSA1/START domain
MSERGKYAIEVRQLVPAPQIEVFEAWTTPTTVRKWSAPPPMTVGIVEIDLRIGGQFRVDMVDPDGAVHRVRGEYREVSRPARLVYTWNWDGAVAEDTSLVTVEFVPVTGGTEVVLRHQRLPSAKSAGEHDVGWRGCLGKFTAAVGSRD